MIIKNCLAWVARRNWVRMTLGVAVDYETLSEGDTCNNDNINFCEGLGICCEIKRFD